MNTMNINDIGVIALSQSEEYDITGGSCCGKCCCGSSGGFSYMEFADAVLGGAAIGGAIGWMGGATFPVSVALGGWAGGAYYLWDTFWDGE